MTGRSFGRGGPLPLDIELLLTVELVDAKVCLDCLQTHSEQQREINERDKRLEAQFAAKQQQDQ